MERESFEDEEVAQILNDKYISIKVDREERPDVDHIYMNVCQILTGHGGWPLTIIMTSEKKPFYAGTYFPKHSRMGYPGLVEVLEKISDMWVNDRQTLIESAESIIQHISEDVSDKSEEGLSLETAHRAFQGFLRSFDHEYGGFGSAPKFPTPHNLSFLLRYWKVTKDDDALSMVEKTLEQMYRGGIYDHIGFGFSRYSTDRKWLVPHFEKMLYDNALLTTAYLEAYQATGKEQYAEVARQILTYVLRDMTSPDGGFYSAEDADSEGVEGKFYVWRQEEVKAILGEQEGKQFCDYYGIVPKGNFEGSNIPNLLRNQKAFGELNRNPLTSAREKIYKTREKRIHPYKDDKILTSWNGLMIAAMALGYRVLGDEQFATAAEKAVDFIQHNLRRSDGRLLARYRDGEAAYSAYLDDYAFMIWGLIDLYEATFKSQYLKLAVDLTTEMMKYFYDEEQGGFYLYGSDSEQLITRPKDVYDSAAPSGNSVTALNLLRLSRITGNNELEDKAWEIFNAFSPAIDRYPMGYTHMLMAVLYAHYKGSEVVIVGSRDMADIKKMFQTINRNFLPFSVFVFKNTTEADKDIFELVPYIEKQHMVASNATAYVCENFACQAPITDTGELERIIAGN